MANRVLIQAGDNSICLEKRHNLSETRVSPALAGRIREEISLHFAFRDINGQRGVGGWVVVIAPDLDELPIACLHDFGNARLVHIAVYPLQELLHGLPLGGSDTRPLWPGNF